MKCRAKLARERAGLSVGQACKLLNVGRETLVGLEEHEGDFEDADVDLREVMAEIYGVSPEWLAGDGPRRNYAAVDAMKGADRLSFHDRDELAEFAASLPGRRA